MKSKLIQFISVITLCLAAFSARASILLQDNFTYSDGFLPTNSVAFDSLGVWFKYSGNGSRVPVSGGQLYLGESFSDDVTSPLTNAPYTAASATNVLYSSFTVNFQIAPTNKAGGFYFAFFKDTNAGTTFKARVYALTNGVPAGDLALGMFRLGIANAAGTASVTNTTDLSLHTTYTVVTRLILPIGYGGNPTNLASTLWVTSDTSSFNETSPSITATDASGTITVSDYAFREPGAVTTPSAGAATMALDNLVVGTSFADVVPASAGANPPFIISQPQDLLNIFEGNNVSFSTEAGGDAPSYQWYTNTTPLAGATNATLWLSNITVSAAGGYWASITNAAGSNYTRTATLTVSVNPIPPIITNQPASAIINLGDSTNFTVVAGGANPLSYQWNFVSGGVTNLLSGATHATLALSGVNYSQAGTYFVTITNQFGITNSANATLTVNAPPLLNVANLRATLDPTTYAPTNTTSLFRVRGIVTTFTDMTASGSSSFYIQDASAGINVFWQYAPSSTNLPPAGALVEVVAPLANFYGLLELEPVFTNSLHSVTVISTNNPLPAPLPLPFDSATQNNPAIMEMLEGSYLVATNVLLDSSSGIFVSSSGGEQITNALGETFLLYINSYTDIPGQPKPAGPVTIYGVLGQYVKASPYTGGYEFTPSRYVDIVPVVRFTNVLQNLTRAGDLPTNNFVESVLRPGEKLTMNLTAADPAGGTVTIQPLTGGLPASAGWARTTPASGLTATNSFHFQPVQNDAGTNYVVALSVTTSTYGTFTNVWNVYVPTNFEQKIYISEFLANPTTDTNSPFFNPLKRTQATTNNSVDDEYIEIANLSGTNVDLLNWSISDAVKMRLQFANGAGYGESLGSSNAIVVYGGPLNGNAPNLPVLNFPASESTAGLALNNTGTETIMLRNGDGHLIDRVFYYGSDLSTNGSMSRFPTLTNSFVPQSYISTNLVTPGRQYDGGAWNLPTKVPTGVSGIAIVSGNPVTLSFTADTSVATTLWQADSLANKFSVVNGLQFTNAAGVFYITNPPPAQQFYYITTQ